MTFSLAADHAPAERANIQRAIIAATIGTIIEWFDYALYGAASGLVINRLFFPQFSTSAGILAAFATFAVGFFGRPLGGIVISHFGDRFGRKPALIFTISLMGVSTVAMGLLPTYAQVGILAPILLIICRLLQGFGAGAEYAGAVTLVAEYVPSSRKAYFTAYLQAAAVAGIMLATLLFLFVAYLPEDVLFAWAWRIPFLVSALLLGVALYIRKRLDETSEYVEAMERAAAQREEARAPIVELFRNSPREVVCGFLTLTGHNANVYILNTFSLSYMTNTLGMARTDALTAVIIATSTGIVLTPPMGALADRVGHARVYLFGAIFTLLFAFPMFAMLDSKSLVLASLALSIAFGIGFGGLASAQGAFLANLFPTRCRFSGIALAREMSALLIAGPTPFIASALVDAGGGKPTWVVVYLMSACAISVVSILVIRSRSRERGSA
ncbi:MFS transporter [Bradyrhizobium brasilense]|uniref:MFS transporter n=1 Tax=Bradyrhizobium brasilense TaxID=1419277 RepID=UPI00145733E9|nr:MFS transporter [Bradyrhizobium brasilense]